MSSFTESEIELIIEGLDILDSTEKSTISFVNSLGSGLKLYADSGLVDEHMQERNRASQIKREQIIMLQAKLIKMKDKSFIDDLD